MTTEDDEEPLLFFLGLGGDQTNRGLLGVIGEGIQQLLWWVEWPDITRDEDRLPIEIYDGANAGSVRVAQCNISLESLCSLQ